MILIEAICAYYYPLTGDDRYFQSLNVLSVGKMIQYLKAFGNGRYLGNLAVVLLVNNKMLRVMVKTICIVGIWVNLVYLCELEEKRNFGNSCDFPNEFVICASVCMDSGFL